MTMANDDDGESGESLGARRYGDFPGGVASRRAS